MNTVKSSTRSGKTRAARGAARLSNVRCGVLVCTIAAGLTAGSAAWSQDDGVDLPFEQNRTTYGDIGLIEMPSARMAPDGEMSLAIGDLNANQWRIGAGFQLLPWVETTFRYGHIPHFFGNGLPLYDRSFGVKIRLFQETAYTPALAIGARDVVGTGVFGQEFIVLSKRFWTADFTLGLGWGRLASTGMFPNPVGLAFPSFNTRSTNTGQGGTISLGQLFHGPDTSLFGGINWQTPIDRLSLIVEYSSDRYLQERRHNLTDFSTRIPVNFAASYRLFDHVTLTGGYLYGTTWGAVISFHFNPTQPFYDRHLGTLPLPPYLRSPQQRNAALIDLTNRNPVTAIDRGKVSLDIGADPTHLKEVLAAAPSSVARNYEVDGRTLAIDVDGPTDMQAQCSIFSQVVANSVRGIDTVAIADLSGRDGNVVLCPVNRNKQAALAPLPETDVSPENNGAPAAIPSIPDEELELRPSITDPRESERKIRADADQQNLTVDAVSVSSHTATVYFSNTKYYFEADAIGRMVRILLADTPADIEIFRIVSVYHGVPMRETKILRSNMERAIRLHGSAAEIRNSISLLPAPMDNPILDAQQDGYPRVGWSIYPRLERSFFDPKAPVRIGVFADGDGYVELMPGLTLEGTFDASIYNDLGTNLASNSELPHVRSDFGLYYEHGSYGLSRLDATYRTRLAGDVFAEVKAGYLEDMFMGAGGQVLWRPNGARWAIGVDVYQVWQRAYDRLFGVLSGTFFSGGLVGQSRAYKVASGHVSVYYESPWYGIDVAVHAGRYLAGDWGGTLEVSRHFSTGVEVGAFATFTNVPFSKFGEGSFDKGVILRIPLEWLLPVHSQSEANFDFRPLSRDGGQRLENDDSLYDETRRTGYGEIDEHIDDIVSP